ncbi:UNVERIFIED_CONTAM: hypothetical protein GTU68_033006 [Idotea baltica]|nr:hypothetical protein [Idotea baltica]
MSKYDLIIIGSGPGGYVGAIRAAQLGLKTAIIEKYPTLGGTCLNVGCIPSKALLDSSEHYHNAEKSFETHGIKISDLAIDLKQMVKRKDDVVSQTCKGVEFLMKKNKIDVLTDFCLIAIGRKPYTEGLGLENTKIELDEKGRVKVNEHLETGESGVYAIGDVIPGAMLAHKAEEEGIFVAELLAGQKPHIDYNLIPGVVYTWPEVSAVGATEEMLKEKGIEYKVGKFPFKALGRARASMDTEGMVKVLADKNTDEILGVHMVGPRCADLIMEAVSLMEFRASAEDMSRISHPHPTFTEAVKEAALAATGDRALHV